MEENGENTMILTCFGCLSGKERRIQEYKIQCESLKKVIKRSTLNLCYICKRIAQHAELLIQNILFYQNTIEYCNKKASLRPTVQPHIRPCITLSYFSHNRTEFSCFNQDLKAPELISNNPIKVELTEDLLRNLNTTSERKYAEALNYYNDELDCIDDAGFENDNVKEDDLPLHLLKKKHKLDNDVKAVLKKHECVEIKDEVVDSLKIEKFYITLEKCIEEREQSAKDKKYVNSTYKCEDCIKGFNFKASYELHRKRHSEDNGNYECDICKLRMDTKEKLSNHKRFHTTRYRCPACGVCRVSRLTIKDHYDAYHRSDALYVCPYCSKAFKRQVSQRKHVRYTHMPKQRQTCSYCNKSYANKEVLKSHMMMSHPKEVSARQVTRRFPCDECGKAFMSPSQLKRHSTSHSVNKSFYCVECDKSFKSEKYLSQHLKTALTHLTDTELPFSCQHCDNKFAVKRSLEKHMNKVHLNIKPYRCDKCDKAYIQGWSLTLHKRHIHEGYRKPRKYPCTMCDKIFESNAILKAHLRTHTGERPFGCSTCGAHFSQSGVLATHVRLVHLRLTRDGRPKPLNN